MDPGITEGNEVVIGAQNTITASRLMNSGGAAGAAGLLYL